MGAWESAEAGRPQGPCWKTPGSYSSRFQVSVGVRNEQLLPAGGARFSTPLPPPSHRALCQALGPDLLLLGPLTCSAASGVSLLLRCQSWVEKPFALQLAFWKSAKRKVFTVEPLWGGLSPWRGAGGELQAEGLLGGPLYRAGVGRREADLNVSPLRAQVVPQGACFAVGRDRRPFPN